MPTYIAFLRAVNVGGRYVKMAEVREALTEAGFADVQTHIQSGNVLVRSARRTSGPVAVELSRVLTAHCGFDVPAIVRTPAQLRATVAAIDDVPPLLAEESKRYVAFADAPVPAEAAAVLDAWDKPGERVRVRGAEVLAEMSTGFHKTTLTNTRLERLTGRITTWRDLSVVRTIDEKWGA
jgi:uncharacterized protein (DUF1697 family)